MATIAVHEFISLDGVFEDPTWTFEFGFDPKMGETIAECTGRAPARMRRRPGATRGSPRPCVTAGGTGGSCISSWAEV